MCRLFGMISTRASNASKYLLSDPCSLYSQSNVNPRMLQGDGWGIGSYTGNISHLVKSEKPVYKEFEKFASVVQRTSSKIILAHIRRASNPRGLPKKSIVSIENSQPFQHRNYLFAHNGTITMPDEVAESLGEWTPKIRGLNDSEVYFWYVVKGITEGASFADGVRKFERILSELWHRNREKHPDKDRPYVGLNALFSDGERLYAYSRYHKQDESRKSLCLGDQPVFQMSYLVSPTKLVIASEKTNSEEKWKPLKSGQLLTAQIRGEKISLDLQEVE